MRKATILCVLLLPLVGWALPSGSPAFAVQLPRGDGTPIVRAADYGFSATNDFNAAAINRALEACRVQGAQTLELAPGVYRCFDASQGIAVTNFTDLTFDGRGARLVFRRPDEFRSRPSRERVCGDANLLVGDCVRVKVCDFKMDVDGEPDSSERQDGGRNGIRLVAGRHVTVQDVDIWGCFGKGIVIDGKQTFTQIENVRIEPRSDAPAHRRLCSAASDGLHVAQSGGFVKFLNCRVRLARGAAIRVRGDGASDVGNVIVRNCVFEDFARGNLFSSSNLMVEDCTFRRGRGCSLVVREDARKRPGREGRVVTNIVIRGNLFEACGVIDCETPTLTAAGGVPGMPRADETRAPDVLKDILVEENVFVDPQGAAFRADSGTDITFRNNEIRFTHAPSDPECGRAAATDARRVTIEGNSWLTNPPPHGVTAPQSRAVTTATLGTYPVRGDVAYDVRSGYVAESLTEGAVIALAADELDAIGNVLAAHESSPWGQAVCAVGFRHPLRLSFRTKPDATAVRVKIHAAGNPVTFTPMPAFVRPMSRAPLYAGIYDKEDPMPDDRAAALASLARVPPATAMVERRDGRNVAVVDGFPTPLNEYKGFTDYRLMGECGGHVVMTFNRGTRLFLDVSFDKAVRDAATGSWDFSRIEDTLLRIHCADPRARVILGIDLDPDNAFLESHPESIFVNEQGVRGRVNFQAFAGFDSSPLDPKKVNHHWAYSYASAEWQALVSDGLRRLCAYLRTTPAANIVIGFHLAGGMDGQFVQWQYGPENGHFDYSEANRQALCRYLAELYGTDAALQKAWGDASVTLATARNPTVAEFRSIAAFDDRPGLGRRLADCRRFVSVGPARALNGFAKTLRRNFGRPCLVDTWYTSTIWSQPGRLALDELVKDDGVNVIVTVSGYSYKRALDGPGASADNAIAGLNLRGLLFVQEMDHRSWRTVHTGGFMSSDAIAIPRDERDFGNQIRRDGASVIAAGGAGFHLFDMFGSWYHGSKVKEAISEIFALNRFATRQAGAYAPPRIGIFADEKARLLRESTFDNLDVVWRTSGVMPAIHYLTDIESPQLPEYDLYIAYHPVTVTAAQVEAFRRRASVCGKVLAVVGEAGCASRDFADTAEVLKRLGLTATAHPKATMTAGVRPEPGDPLTEGLSGLMELGGVHISNGRAVPRAQVGYATVVDASAKTLGTWSNGAGVAFARKPLGAGTLVFVARDGGLTPRLLHNLARAADVRPFSEPGNATYVGNGVACVHRLAGPARVDFGRPVKLVDFRARTVSPPTRVWEPKLAVGESAAVGYFP